MANPVVTYTFTNGNVADASQVNQNFTDLINSLTDGTKSLNIDALTAAGAATLNGNVTLGNAAGDAIVCNGTFGANQGITGSTNGAAIAAGKVGEVIKSAAFTDFFNKTSGSLSTYYDTDGTYTLPSVTLTAGNWTIHLGAIISADQSGVGIALHKLALRNGSTVLAEAVIGKTDTVTTGIWGSAHISHTVTVASGDADKVYKMSIVAKSLSGTSVLDDMRVRGDQSANGTYIFAVRR